MLSPTLPRVARKLAQLAWRLVLVGWLAFAALVLILRYLVLPGIGQWHGEIEQLASRAIGQTVRIEKVAAGWAHLHPELQLSGVRIVDAQGRETLAFSRVEAVLSWRSLALLELRLRRILLAGPQVHAERGADGHLWVAGWPVDLHRQTDPGLTNWVLQQPDVVITDARVFWRDLQRGAPELLLDQVNLRLENAPGRHVFSLRALPPSALGGPFDLRGDFTGAADDASAASFKDWQGSFYLASGGLDFKVAQQWLDSPIDLAAGQGALRLWGKVEAGRPREISADLALRGVDVRLGETLPRLALENLQGRLRWRQSADGGSQLTGYELGLALADGFVVEPTSFHVEWTPPSAGGVTKGLAIVTAIDVGQLKHLSDYLPLDAATRGKLAGYAPSGRLANLQVSWNGTREGLLAYSAEADFAELAMQASGELPGFAGLSGHLRADEKGGRVELVGGPLSFDFPGIFEASQIALDELQAKAEWRWQDGSPEAAPTLSVELTEASFSGADAAASAHGKYRYTGHGLGELDLEVQVHEAKLAAAWRYMPRIIPVKVQNWLQGALLAGTLREGKLVLRGPLDRFPFPNNEGGQFLVSGKVDGASLEYAAGWPKVDDVSGELVFAGAGMSLNALNGASAGARLAQVAVQLPDFKASPALLKVSGEARGNLDDFTRFLDQSPVGEMLGHFYREIKVSGDAGLKLDLRVPLDDPAHTRVRGEVELAGNQVLVDPLLPPVSEVRGRVGFSEKDATANDLAGVFLGRPMKASIITGGDDLRVVADGSALLAELRRHYGYRALDHLSGSLPWKADVTVKKGRVTIKVESSLEGLASALPEPLTKAAETVLPVRFTRIPLLPERSGKASATAAASAGRDELDLDVGEILHASLVRRSAAGRSTIERGVVAIGERLPLPTGGLRIGVRQEAVQADAWRAALAETPRPALENGAETAPQATSTSTVDWPTPQLDIRAKSLQLFARVWKDVKLQASPVKGGIAGQIETHDMAGSWEWETAGKGKLKARLQQLLLPDEKTRAIGEPVPGNGHAEGGGLEQLPALDIVAEQLVIGERRLGRMELQAENEAKAWQISRFTLDNADGKIEASGRWQPTHFKGATGETSLTAIKFNLQASDLGKWLGRFGYADAVRSGKGTLDGEISWRGTPARLTPPTLSGSMKASAEKGQFNKLEPGVGKLLSLLSLQMLPRRATLDFRDVFSDGFSFDRIDGTVNVNEGIMRTSDLVIEGPPAKVLMKGEVDLDKETQNVRVTVQPEIGGSVALGAALAINPATGVAALLAQKILRDPLNKAFSFDYDIKGAWADPTVEKVGRNHEKGGNGKPVKSSDNVGP
jgi:uncharacterized protein (TIGR02099 family)